MHYPAPLCVEGGVQCVCVCVCDSTEMDVHYVYCKSCIMRSHLSWKLKMKVAGGVNHVLQLFGPMETVAVLYIDLIIQVLLCMYQYRRCVQLTYFVLDYTMLMYIHTPPVLSPPMVYLGTLPLSPSSGSKDT